MGGTIVIPKDNEVKKYTIPEGVRLSKEMEQDMVQLHKTNPMLHQLILQDAMAANKVALDMSSKEESQFDFSWEEYTLRDVVVRQHVTRVDMVENLRMLGLNDVDSSKMLNNIMSEFMHIYVTLLLYYGAPADSECAFSHVRFIDVIGMRFPPKTDDDEKECLYRNTFFRYTREL